MTALNEDRICCVTSLLSLRKSRAPSGFGGTAFLVSTTGHGVEDALVVHQKDLDFPTTDVAEIREFLAAPGDGVRIVFSTYQSARAVGEAVQGITPFDLGIFDEAHKTAGREGANFAFALKDQHIEVRRGYARWSSSGSERSDGPGRLARSAGFHFVRWRPSRL